jgi:hypothetical protein
MGVLPRKATRRRVAASRIGADLPLVGGFRIGSQVGVVAMEIKAWTSDCVESPTASTKESPASPASSTPTTR